MSVVRMTEFKARGSTLAKMKEILTALVPHMLDLSGCEGCFLIENQEDPTKFQFIEFWTSIEAHKAATKDIPTELIGAVMPLLGGIPSGSYYDLVQKVGTIL